jgi:hypothetical protein
MEELMVVDRRFVLETIVLSARCDEMVSSRRDS